MTIDELFTIIEKRKKEIPESSYVASLVRQGNDRIIQKVGEEATEVVIAAKNGQRQRIVEEVTDLLFHTLVLLSVFNISPREILAELEKRKK